MNPTNFNSVRVVFCCALVTAFLSFGFQLAGAIGLGWVVIHKNDMHGTYNRFYGVWSVTFCTNGNCKNIPRPLADADNYDNDLEVEAWVASKLSTTVSLIFAVLGIVLTIVTVNKKNCRIPCCRYCGSVMMGFSSFFAFFAVILVSSDGHAMFEEAVNIYTVWNGPPDEGVLVLGTPWALILTGIGGGAAFISIILTAYAINKCIRLNENTALAGEMASSTSGEENHDNQNIRYGQSTELRNVGTSSNDKTKIEQKPTTTGELISTRSIEKNIGNRIVCSVQSTDLGETVTGSHAATPAPYTILQDQTYSYDQ